MTMTAFEFNPTDIPDTPTDSIPPLSDVEYPCDVCGQESGPYGGRGPKPRKCANHKRKSVPRTSRISSGNANNLAGQATAVLEQGNALIAIVLGSARMFKSAQAMMEHNEAFKEDAYAALVADPDMCRFLLKARGVSSKMGLTMAYLGLGMRVGPIVWEEYSEKRAARLADAENDSYGA